MRKIPIAILLSCLALAAVADTLKVATYGGSAAVDLACWSPESPWVGNPNVCNRLDRVVFHFDLSRYLLAGRVSSASITVPMTTYGLFDQHTFELEAFERGHAPVIPMDILAGGTAPVGTVTANPGDQPVLRFDVTEVINRALETGDGVATFRVRDLTIEKLGNRKGHEEGGAVERSLITLEVAR